MNQNRLNHLLKKFASGELSGEEQQELENLLALSNRDELAERIAALTEENNDPSFSINKETAAETFNNIIASDKSVPVTSNAAFRIGRRWFTVAAAILLSLSAVVYYMLSKKQEPVVAMTETRRVMPEKEPGRNVAILTLADNSQVELDSMGNGLVATQAGARVLLTNGQLAYKPPANVPPNIAYNKISTPRGGEYSLTLSDGTKIWLNAASSLTFPTLFTGPTREVELTGEAYLEVAEDKQHPFIIKIRDIDVAVLGTELNIMGYNDEPGVVTTLVTGSVRVSSPGNADQLLAPGQHAMVDNHSGNIMVEKADVEAETAWKNGRILFTGANIRKIMRQVSRWYDVDVQYQGNVLDLDFTCTVSRKDKLSRLLKLIELTKAVHFTMEGNTVIVQP